MQFKGVGQLTSLRNVDVGVLFIYSEGRQPKVGIKYSREDGYYLLDLTQSSFHPVDAAQGGEDVVVLVENAHIAPIVTLSSIQLGDEEPIGLPGTLVETRERRGIICRTPDGDSVLVDISSGEEFALKQSNGGVGYSAWVITIPAAIQGRREILLSMDSNKSACAVQPPRPASAYALDDAYSDHMMAAAM